MTTSTTASDNIATTGTTLKIQTGHDCQSNGYSAGGDIVYRRSDDPNNQNMYMSGDGLGTVTTKGLATTRGSPDVYFVDETQNQANAKAFIKSYVASTNTATFDAAHAAGTAAKVVLNENYAGGQLQTVCSTCVTAYTAAGTSLTVDQNILLAVDDRILISGKVHEDFVSTIGTATGTGGVGGTAVVPSAGALRGGSATGLCKCFKGYSNDNCDTQNMLAA